MPNRLAGESSPYLLQHKNNPVDWYPWGTDAFDRARREEKPIFLSIGYSACHWCHVMERESFASEHIATVLNEHFIAVKVDREERPDIDQTYMAACAALTGQGGWPLTVFLTPDKRPFFAGTYFPPTARGGMPGLIDLLNLIADTWANDRDRLTSVAGELTVNVNKSLSGLEPGSLSSDARDRAVAALASQYDDRWGGFGPAPKFPMPATLLFLLSVPADTRARDMAQHTLVRMYQGGIYDHIGGGFCRYATDDRWLIPHFEKMLYDNAQLALAYLEGAAVLNRPLLGAIARDILLFVDRELSHPGGGFCSSLDADNPEGEGAFYLFTPDQTRDILGTDRGDEFNRLYGITTEGVLHGKSIPNLLGLDPGHLDRLLEDPGLARDREQLLRARSERTRPGLDDKVLTGWNGLAIAACATAARMLDDGRWLERAQSAARFVTANLIREDGRLLASYRSEPGSIPAYLTDYAFLTMGVLELYRTGQEPGWLQLAVRLTDGMLELFMDNDVLYLTGSDQEQILARPLDIHDGALPAGTSVAVQNLLMLGSITGEPGYQKTATRIIDQIAGQINRAPSAFTFLLRAVALSKPATRVIIAGTDGESIAAMMRVVDHRAGPGTAVVVHHGDGRLDQIVRGLSDIPVTQSAMAYVCRGQTCLEPASDPEALDRILTGG